MTRAMCIHSHKCGGTASHLVGVTRTYGITNTKPPLPMCFLGAVEIVIRFQNDQTRTISLTAIEKEET